MPTHTYVSELEHLMSGLLGAAIAGDLTNMQRLLNEGDSICEGRNVPMTAAIWARFSLVQWLLEEGGANITDVIIHSGNSESLWDNLLTCAASMELISLLKVIAWSFSVTQHPTSFPGYRCTIPKLRRRAGGFECCDHLTWSISVPQSTLIVASLPSFSLLSRLMPSLLQRTCGPTGCNGYEGKCQFILQD
jgi:hypothetical protein